MKFRLGIIGGGQLGRMLTQSAKKLGFTVWIIDPTPQSPAGQIADYQSVEKYTDEQAIRKVGAWCDVLTFEIEHVNSDVLEDLANKGVAVHPSPKTLRIIKDKLKQKEFLRENNVPVADFVPVQNKNDVVESTKKFGYPILLKARFDAYDGRGNVTIYNKRQIDEALKKLDKKALYVEKYIPFEKELAIMVARGTNGMIRSFPVVETIHKNHICHTVVAPAPVNKTVSKKAKKYAEHVMKYLKGAGVFGIEMFLKKNGEVLINEIAPRVHNSGHFTIEACITNQFEQHVRAIAGLPLGLTDMTVPAAVMINILGTRQADASLWGLEKALKIPGVSVHIYGKKETRPERKMGHVTAIGSTTEQAHTRAKHAREALAI